MELRSVVLEQLQMLLLAMDGRLTRRIRFPFFGSIVFVAGCANALANYYKKAIENQELLHCPKSAVAIFSVRNQRDGKRF